MDKVELTKALEVLKDFIDSLCEYEIDIKSPIVKDLIAHDDVLFKSIKIIERNRIAFPYMEYMHLDKVSARDKKDMTYSKGSIEFICHNLPVHVLTKEEEQFLFELVNRGNRAALDVLVKYNERLVISIVRPFYYVDMDFADIIQEGNIGLLLAIERFEPSFGYKFSTYATPVIKQSLYKAFEEQKDLIRKPANIVRLINKINKNVKDFSKNNGYKPTSLDIQNLMPELSIDEIDTLAVYALKPLSLDRLSYDESDETFTYIKNNLMDESDYESEILDKITKENILQYIKESPEVSDLNYQILLWRFGITKEDLTTTTAIAKKLGISSQAVSKRINTTLERLRDKLTEKGIHL